MSFALHQLFKLIILSSTLFVLAGQANAETCSAPLPFSQDATQSCQYLNPTGNGTITNAGTISENVQDKIYQGAIYNNANITVITNTGTIQNLTKDSAIYNNARGGIETIVNSGVINSQNINNGIFNSGSIRDITNLLSGQITGADGGIYSGFGGQITGTILNRGTIFGVSEGIMNVLGGSINTIINWGVIGSTNTGILNLSSSIESIVNNSGGLIEGSDNGIFNTGAGAIIGSITNTGTISGSLAGISQDLTSEIGNVNNSGIITGNVGIQNSLSNIGTITNNSGGLIQGSFFGISNIITFDPDGTPVGTATINLITNKAGAMISGFSSGIYNEFSIGSITNTGTISGGDYGVGNDGSLGNPVIDTIINDAGGVITGNLAGIGNSGTIYTLNNAQGNLTYSGNLPQNYGIILGSNSSAFGRLFVSNAAAWDSDISSDGGKTSFGIYSGSVKSAKYLAVISGVAAGFLNTSTLSGTYSSAGKSYAYSLALESGSLDTWDLLFPTYGPSATDTQSSLTRLASGLRGVHNIASLISHYPNSSTYDCNLFDVKGMCISAGGRYSTVDNPSSNSSAAVVTLGYKVSPNIRIGGFLDQSVNNNAPTGINLSNKHPMMGAFLYWNQQPDGLGYQVKIANAYQDKDLSTTRDVIGTSEAGRGTTSLNSRSYVGELSYAFMYKENTLVRPYFALRHTRIEQDAYTETGVTTPLTYSALNDRTTSALMGVKFKHALTPKANLTGSLGLEQDLHHKTDQLMATSASIAGLTSENFSGDIHRTRPVASIGATYDIAKTQRLSGEVLVQQLPFQSTAGATAYFNYMIGF